MTEFFRKLSRVGVGPKLPVGLWWTWRTLGFPRPATLIGEVTVAGGSARLEWRHTGELLQAMNIFDPRNGWNRWRPGHPVQTVLDVGANVGQTIAYWQLRFPAARVAGVEMMPDNAARIRRQAGLNGWPVDVAEVAATDSEQLVRVHLSEANSRNRLEEVVEASAVRDRLRAETVQLPGRPLGTILDQLGWPEVDLVKVDIEGAEVNLLRDAARWAPRVRTLILEVHDNVDRAWARQVLEDAGFELLVLTPGATPEWLCVRDPVQLAP